MWRFWWQPTSLELCCYALDGGPDLAATAWALGAQCCCDVLIIWNCLGEWQPGTFCLLEHCLHLIFIIISLHCSDQPFGCCWDSSVCLFLFLSLSLSFSLFCLHFSAASVVAKCYITFFFSSSDKADKKAEISKLSKMEQERMVCGKIIQYVVNFCLLQFMRNVIQTLCVCVYVCACMCVLCICIHIYVCVCVFMQYECWVCDSCMLRIVQLWETVLHLVLHDPKWSWRIGY